MPKATDREILVEVVNLLGDVVSSPYLQDAHRQNHMQRIVSMLGVQPKPLEVGMRVRVKESGYIGHVDHISTLGTYEVDGNLFVAEELEPAPLA